MMATVVKVTPAQVLADRRLETRNAWGMYLAATSKLAGGCYEEVEPEAWHRLQRQLKRAA